MFVTVNMSREVYNYFKDYDLSQIADTLLDMYDFTTLPPIGHKPEVQKSVNVENEAYIALYNTVGPRSKKCSLGRLFEFAYTMDVLSMPRFEKMRVTTELFSPVPALIDRAYKALLGARKYDDSEELKIITDAVYNYREVLRDEQRREDY
jgi:hypothetical protein